METLEAVASAILGVLKDAGIPAALTGGLAANAWVATEDVAATYDVDVATLIPEGIQFSASTLADAFTTRSGIRCMHGSDLDLPKAKIVRLVTIPKGTVIDMVMANRTFAGEALSRTSTIESGGERHPILSPEDLILYKGLARRDKDRTAIVAIAKRQTLDRAYIERWARRLGIWKFVSSGLKAPQ